MSNRGISLVLAVLLFFVPLGAAEEFTLLNFNVCFISYPFCRFFGGVDAPSARLEGIARLIIESGADVVCLQEVFTSEGELKKRLRKEYPYIYSGFGGAPFKTGSGLFIASRHPCRGIHFSPFRYEGMQQSLDKGYVSFDLLIDGEVGAHLVATHLQPFCGKRDREIRALELQEIAAHLEERRAVDGGEVPYLLVGDLNIPWGTEEYFVSPLPTHFVDGYTAGFSSVDFSNCTCSDYIQDQYWGEVEVELLAPFEEPRFPLAHNRYMEIVDYALLVAGDSKNYTLSTERVQAFDFFMPSRALSDHHALLSRIKRTASTSHN